MMNLFEEISAKFDLGIKNVFVSGTASFCEAFSFFKDNFKKVIFVSYNRDEYIDKNIFSIDTILKKCIIDSYINMGEKPESHDFLEMLENDLDDGALVIVDNYNIPSPSPFLRHLLCSDGRIIVKGKHFNEPIDDAVLLYDDSYCEEEVVAQIDKPLFVDYSFSLDIDSAIVFYKDLCRTCDFYDDNPEVIYGLLMILSQDKSGKAKTLANIGYFLKKLYSFSERQMCDEIYNSPLPNISKRNMLFDSYLRLKFDIIDICKGLLLDLTGDLYRINEPVFEVLYKTLADIYNFIRKSETGREEVISYCVNSLIPLLSAFELFDSEGHFSTLRCSDGTFALRPFYSLYPTIYEGFGLSMVKSKTVVRIYGEFQRLLLLSDNEKFKEKAKSISRNYVFVRNGFENFSDYFSVKNSNVLIADENMDDDFDNRLLHNKHLLVRGFDNGTGTGAVRYAEKVMETLKKSKNPLELFTLLLDYSFPISDECFERLLKMGVCDLFTNNSKICDREKGNFLLHLSLILREDDMKTSLSAIIIKLITVLSEGAFVSEKSKNRLLENVSRMFVSFVFRNINDTSVVKDSFSVLLFEKYSYSTKTSEGVVAKTLYDFYVNNKTIQNPDSVYPYFTRLKNEYSLCDCSGFDKAVKDIFG